MRLLVGPRKDECVPLEDPAVVKGLLTPILDFLRSKKCYDFLPDSTQVVVLDLDLPLMHTFSVAHEHNVTFATLWDRRTSKYCGMMTVTDYINMLLQYHRDPAGLQAFIQGDGAGTRVVPPDASGLARGLAPAAPADEESDFASPLMQEFMSLPIRRWRDSQRKGHTKHTEPLMSCDPEDSLFTALNILRVNRIHRLPVIDPATETLLYVLGRKILLQYFAADFPLDSQMFAYSIFDLKVGTFGRERVTTLGPTNTLFEYFSLMMETGLGGLPVMDDTGALVDIFSRYDIVYIAKEAERDLDTPFAAITHLRPANPIYVCSRNDSLGSVFNHLMKFGVQRLVIVGESDNLVDGIVTIGDIVHFMFRYHADPTDPPPSAPAAPPAPDAPPTADADLGPDPGPAERRASAEGPAP
jgi:5'-AMP-activated protein kinase regulatory gamma subunit